MKTSILLVDDYEPWRRFERLTLLVQEDLQIVGEASDGDEAIQKVQQLQPELILLDISLPCLNGIETALALRPSLQRQALSASLLVGAAER